VWQQHTPVENVLNGTCDLSPGMPN
jgi:hypothetical protein